MFLTGIVLGAGASRRLGQPKQLLPFAGTTLLGATVQRARECRFDQLLVTTGGAAAEVRDHVDLTGAEVVESADYATGCSASLRVALECVDPRAGGFVLLLGDQPGVRVDVVHELVDRAGGGPIGVCRYLDGLGHPFWFGRETFADLRRLHGDKAVWKLVQSDAYPVVEHLVEERVPVDVDTWADYDRLSQVEATPR